MRLAFLVSLSIIASAAVAQEQPSAPAKAPKEKKICRQDTATGSIMPHRTCRTAAEWKQMEQQNASNVDQASTAFNRSQSGNAGRLN